MKTMEKGFLEQAQENIAHVLEGNEDLNKIQEWRKKETPVWVKNLPEGMEKSWRVTQLVIKDETEEPVVVVTNKDLTLQKMVGVQEFLRWQKEGELGGKK